ncbi:MAG TPA: 50S ribosomal protein L29 [Rhizomicrobium sp.]|nr:50S ribosomal protein L29 [Rhizomicrobium sp.]
MELDEFRQMAPADLRIKEREMREELFRFRLKLRTNQLENPGNYKKSRRELARLLTVIREKEGKPDKAESKASNA